MQVATRLRHKADATSTPALVVMTQHGPDGWEVTLGALKPRTGDGPLEVARIRGDVIVHIPLSDAPERLVFTLSEHEARNLAVILSDVDWPDAST